MDSIRKAEKKNFSLRIFSPLTIGADTFPQCGVFSMRNTVESLNLNDIHVCEIYLMVKSSVKTLLRLLRRYDVVHPSDHDDDDAALF